MMMMEVLLISVKVFVFLIAMFFFYRGFFFSPLLEDDGVVSPVKQPISSSPKKQMNMGKFFTYLKGIVLVFFGFVCLSRHCFLGEPPKEVDVSENKKKKESVVKDSSEKPKRKKREKKKREIVENEEDDVVEKVPKEKKKRKQQEDYSYLVGPVDFPKATVTALMKEAAEHETTKQISKGANLVMSDSARMFVHYLTARADEIAKEKKKNIVTAENVLEALEDLEFQFFIPELQDLLKQTRNVSDAKKAEEKQKKLDALKKELEKREEQNATEKGDSNNSNNNNDINNNNSNNNNNDNETQQREEEGKEEPKISRGRGRPKQNTSIVSSNLNSITTEDLKLQMQKLENELNKLKY